MLKVISVQQCTVRFARWSMFGRGSVDKEKIYEAPEESQEMVEYQQRIDNLEREVREEYIESRRNKSRLSASHQQQVQGRHPYEGVLFEYNNVHRTRKFKRAMLGRYGTKTGINPGVSWPTERDIKLAEEWESLYQPDPLHHQIANIRKEQEDLINRQKEREAKIEANLARLDDQIKAWKVKLAARQRLTDGERGRREKVLAELRAEFGYDVNPEDEMMKGRIAEREKVLAKEDRELKKQMRKEKMDQDRQEAAAKAAREAGEANTKED